MKKMFTFRRRGEVCPSGSSISPDTGSMGDTGPRYHTRSGSSVSPEPSSTGDTGRRYHTRKIHIAAAKGNLKRVKYLLFFRANGLNDRDNMDRTALHWACMNGHPRVVALLVGRNCLLDVCDKLKRTALIKAVQRQEEECVTILLNHGADPNVADIEGNTALHHAVFGASPAIVAKLLSHNADMDVRNKDNLTPLSLARSEKKEQMVEVLLSKAAEVQQMKRLARTPGIREAWTTSDDKDVSFNAKSSSARPPENVNHLSEDADQSNEITVIERLEDWSSEEDSEVALQEKQDRPGGGRESHPQGPNSLTKWSPKLPAPARLSQTIPSVVKSSSARPPENVNHLSEDADQSNEIRVIERRLEDWSSEEDSEVALQEKQDRPGGGRESHPQGPNSVAKRADQLPAPTRLSQMIPSVVKSSSARPPENVNHLSEDADQSNEIRVIERRLEDWSSEEDSEVALQEKQDRPGGGRESHPQGPNSLTKWSPKLPAPARLSQTIPSVVKSSSARPPENVNHLSEDADQSNEIRVIERRLEDWSSEEDSEVALQEKQDRPGGGRESHPQGPNSLTKWSPKLPAPARLSQTIPSVVKSSSARPPENVNHLSEDADQSNEIRVIERRLEDWSSEEDSEMALQEKQDRPGGGRESHPQGPNSLTKWSPKLPAPARLSQTIPSVVKDIGCLQTCTPREKILKNETTKIRRLRFHLQKTSQESEINRKSDKDDTCTDSENSSVHKYEDISTKQSKVEQRKISQLVMNKLKPMFGKTCQKHKTTSFEEESVHDNSKKASSRQVPSNLTSNIPGDGKKAFGVSASAAFHTVSAQGEPTLRNSSPAHSLSGSLKNTSWSSSDFSLSENGPKPDNEHIFNKNKESFYNDMENKKVEEIRQNTSERNVTENMCPAAAATNDGLTQQRKSKQTGNQFPKTENDDSQRLPEKSSLQINQVKEKIDSMDDLGELTQSSERVSEYYSGSFSKNQKANLSHKGSIELAENQYKLLTERVKTLENSVSELYKKLTEREKITTQLLQQKEEVDQELCNLRVALNEEKEKRQNVELLYEKEKEQYMKESERSRKPESTVQTLTVDLTEELKNLLIQIHRTSQENSEYHKAAVRQLEARNKDLESELSELKTGNKYLESERSELKTRNKYLEYELSEMKTRNKYLESKLSKMTARNKYLEPGHSERKTRNKGLESEMKARNYSLESELSEVEARNKDLESEMKARNNNLEFELSEVKTRNKYLEYELSEMKTRNKYLESKLSKMTARNKYLEPGHSERKTRNKGLESEMKARNYSLESELSEVEARNKDLESEMKARNNNLEFELSEVKTRNKYLESKLSKMTTRNKGLESEMKARNNNLESELSEVKTRSKDLEPEMKARNNNLESELSEVETRNKGLESEMKARNNNLESELSEVKTRSKDLEPEMKARNNNLESELSEVETINKDLESEMKARNNNLEFELSEVKTRNKYLESKLSKMTTRNKGLESEMKVRNNNLESELSEVKTRSKDLEPEMKARNNNLESELSEVETINKDLESEMKARNNNLEFELSEVKTRNKYLESKLSKMTTRNKGLESEMKVRNNNLESELSEVKTRSKDLEPEMKARNNNLESELSEVETRNKGLESEMKARNNNLESELSEVKTRNKGLESELWKMNTKSKDLKSELSEMGTKNDNLESALTNLETFRHCARIQLEKYKQWYFEEREATQSRQNELNMLQDKVAEICAQLVRINEIIPVIICNRRLVQEMPCVGNLNNSFLPGSISTPRENVVIPISRPQTSTNSMDSCSIKKQTKFKDILTGELKEGAGEGVTDSCRSYSAVTAKGPNSSQDPHSKVSREYVAYLKRKYLK